MKFKFYCTILIFFMIPGCCLFYESPPLARQDQKQNDICQWQQSVNTKLTKDDIALDKTFSQFKENIAIDHDYLLCSTDNTKQKPPVILLHEINGVEEKTIAYAKDLANDFTVYVPRLIGDRDTGNSSITGWWSYNFNCEWKQKQELNGSMLVTQWLRKFIKTVVQKNHDGKHIGIIGNCLTGALPLALLDNSQVTGVVLAQPTLPIALFYDPEDLEISATEWKNVRARINPKKIKEEIKSIPAKAYLTRFAFDSKSDIKKYEFLVRELSPNQNCNHSSSTEQNLLCNQVKSNEYRYKDSNDKEYKNIDHCAHSVLIGEWQDDKNHPSQIRRDEVRKFLRNLNN